MWYCGQQAWPGQGGLWLLGQMAQDGQGAWGICEQALARQMGLHSILQGVVPPYRRPATPDKEQKLTLQLSVFVPPAPASNRVVTSSPPPCTRLCAFLNQLSQEEERPTSSPML